MVSSEGLNKSIAALLTLEGAGFIKHPDGGHSPLWQGAKLGLGDIVVTSPGSKAVIVLADGSEFEFGKAQGDAVKIDASVLDIVSDVSEVRVLDLSYLYPLLNDNQLDRPSAHLDESLTNLVVADGVDSGEIRDLLDGNPAPASGGDLGGGDLTSGNRYVVLESDPIANDTNPFPINPIPDFVDHPHPQLPVGEGTPLAYLISSFNEPSHGQINPTEPPPAVDPVQAYTGPIQVSLSVASANNINGNIDDDFPVNYQISLDHALSSELVLHAYLIANGGEPLALQDISIAAGQTSYDFSVVLPEELDAADVTYKLVLTHDLASIGQLISDGSEPSPSANEAVVAFNADLLVPSDFATEASESIVTVGWTIFGNSPTSLDDEGNNPGITVTVTDKAILQHVDSSPLTFDVWAVDNSSGASTPFVIAHLTTSSTLDPSQFSDGLQVLQSTNNGVDTLYFDGLLLNFGEGHYDPAGFTLVVTPSGYLSPTDPTIPTNYLSADTPTGYVSLDLPPFVDVNQEVLSFTMHADSLDGNGYLSADPHGQEFQFSVQFNGELAAPINLTAPINVEILIDGQPTGLWVTFDPHNDLNNVPSGSSLATYDGFGTYTFTCPIPDAEDGLSHLISLDLTSVDPTAVGFEAVAQGVPAAYSIYPDVEVSMGAFSVDDELGASAQVSIDHALLDDLVLQVTAQSADGQTIYSEVTILAGQTTAELLVPLDETTEGKDFTVSLAYVYNYNQDSGIPTNQVRFDPALSPGVTLSSDALTVDLSQVDVAANIAFTVPVDTLHMTLTPDVTVISDENPSGLINFTYTIDLPSDYVIDPYASFHFDAQIGDVGAATFNFLIDVCAIDSTSLTWDDVNGNWVGHFNIPATSLTDGIHNLTLVPSDLSPDAATSVFGMDDIVVTPSADFTVVDYTVQAFNGINTYVFTQIDSSDVNNPSGEPLQGADLIEGFGLDEGTGILHFDEAYIGTTANFSSEVTPAESPNINHLEINNGLVTFFNNDGNVDINSSNLGEAVDFLVQHSMGEPGLTVDFHVNNGYGTDTYVFNQGETAPGSSQPSYTLVNVSNQEAAGLSLGFNTNELIHIEHG